MMTEKIAPPFHTVTPSLVVNNAIEAIEFYKKAFGAVEVEKYPALDGKIMYSSIQIGDSLIMIADEFPDMGTKSPLTLGGSAVSIHLYVEDADKIFNQAIDAGAKVIMPMMNAFWGDRFGLVIDPYGHSWSIATPQKNLSPEEIRKAGKEYFSSLTKQ